MAETTTPPTNTQSPSGDSITYCGVTITWDTVTEDKLVYVAYQVTTPGGDTERYWAKIYTPTNTPMVCVVLAHSIALNYNTDDTVVFTLATPFLVPVEFARDFLKNYVTQYCTFAELMEEKSWNR
jgi:hypothetical protein